MSTYDEEPDDFYPDYDDGYCDECGGEGWILTCCDDICHGVGYCIHGDGMEMCACNSTCEPPSNAPITVRVSETFPDGSMTLTGAVALHPSPSPNLGGLIARLEHLAIVWEVGRYGDRGLRLRAEATAQALREALTVLRALQGGQEEKK